jgi:signal transduction histidine kinase
MDDGQSYMASPGLALPPRPKEIEFDYTALSFVAPQRVRFRSKLDGHDTEWQEPGTRRQAFYTDLRPGRYRFHVIACNNDGVWNEEGATLDFRIAPAWFQTVWFRFLCIAAACLMLWGLYRLRIRQVAKAMSARFDERLAERTRMARELHDTFLQTIQGSKLVADDALENVQDPIRTRHALEQLSGWLARATEEGRAALHSLRASTIEKNDLAAAFRRALEDCRREAPSMEGMFSVNGEVREMHPVVRDEVYRIGYEAIRNACTHSAGSRVDVLLSYADDLSVRVRDNGVGIAPLIAETGKDGHFGLQGMRERAARIGAKLTMISSAESGTEVKVVVPGRILFRYPANRVERIKTILKRMNG